MCGIVGIASVESVRVAAWLAAGRDAMAHRGPDDAGEWWSPERCVGFGHRRLAVVDLSPAGHQPLLAPGGDLCIVFNGEIYNFRELRVQLRHRGHAFASESDTEVILAAYREWGAACIERLHGMFALALYDLRERKLLLARDRAGEKPLFYRREGGSIRFASELKALLADTSLPRRVDGEAFDCLLADGFVPPERCILQGFAKLPAAHALLFDVASGDCRTWRYWQPPAPPRDMPVAAAGEAKLVDELEACFEQAVRRQLLADVPVGVLLSGGVDSSLITAFAARAGSGLRTFTVRFPGHRGHDETHHARLIARHFGTQHLELEADAADVDLLPLLARQFDEPMVDSSMVPTYLVSKLVRGHCTVALGGDGGDELFGGYPHYDRMLRLRRMTQGVPRALRSALAAAAGAVIPAGVRGRNWLQAVGTDWNSQVPPVAQLFDAVTRSRIMRRGASHHAVAETLRARRVPAMDDLLQRATRLDFATYLSEDLLVKVDRASMLNSLETRAPMLDVDMLEFAFGKVPSGFKATPASRKVLLKRLAGRVLPPAFDQHRKQGFSIPLDAWLRAGKWRRFFEEVLLDSGTHWLDGARVAKLLAAEGRGHSNGERLFGLVMFELWRREYRPEMPA